MEKTISTFVKNVISILSGDNAEETGIKIQKRASAILSAQIAAKVAATLSLEDTVETLKLRLTEARLNSGQLIIDNNKYVQKLLDTQYELKVAENSLEEHLSDVTFLEEQLVIVKA